MPSEKSARAGERRRQRNAPLRSRAKTFVAKARRLMTANDLEAAEQAVKDAGRLQVEGKDYVVADGDIMYVRFNV